MCEGTEVRTNIAFPGATFKTLMVSTVAECCKSCLATETRCTHWTLQGDDCHLKIGGSQLGAAAWDTGVSNPSNTTFSGWRDIRLGVASTPGEEPHVVSQAKPQQAERNTEAWAPPGSEKFPYKAQHFGLQHDSRCSQGGCDLLVPEPAPQVSWNPQDLPTFPSVCLDPVPIFNRRNPRSPTPTWERPLPPLSVTLGLTAQTCLALCIRTERCMAWTHDDRNGTNACVLRPAFAEEPTKHESTEKVQLKPTAAQAKCTTGLVRAGIARWQTPGTPPQPLRKDASLRGVPVAEMGNCPRRSCLSVPHCAAEWDAAKHGTRFAFVLTDDLQREPPPSKAMRPRALSDPSPITMRLIQAAKAHGADLVYIVPPDSDAKYPITPKELEYFNTSFEKLSRGPWLLPPNMKEPVNGAMYYEMIRFATLGLDSYDAVIYIDSDMHVYGDMTPLFKCVAATDRMLYTYGPQTTFNFGFLAAKPDKRLLKAFEHFMSKASLFPDVARTNSQANGGREWNAGGWDGIGFEPCAQAYITSTAGQGILPALYFKNGERNSTELVDESWRVAGRERPYAYPLDRCKYNFIHETTGYSRSTLCEPTYTCNMSKLVHKQFRKGEAGDKGCFYIPKGTRICTGTWCGGVADR